MRVLLSNNSGAEARRLAAAFPERVGHLYTPKGYRGPFPEFAYYGLESGVFGQPLVPDEFRRFLDRAAAGSARTGLRPAWLAVPDVPFQADETLARWAEWVDECRATGWPLAFVAQNGHTPADVPPEAALVFIGGDREWKWQQAAVFAAAGFRVHVGRVTTARRVQHFAQSGAESCDGTGWFRGDRRQLDRLWYYLADTEGQADCAVGGPMQPRLFPGEWASASQAVAA